MYVPADKYKAQPIRVSIGGEVFAIGGDIHYTPKPPKKPFTVKEATQEQYEKAHAQYTKRAGAMASAILKVKDKEKKDNVKEDVVHTKEPTEPGTGADT